MSEESSGRVDLLRLEDADSRRSYATEGVWIDWFPKLFGGEMSQSQID